MTFPRYAKYKASGVEWLGEVPAHWDVSQLKRVVDPARQITYGIVQAGPHIPDGVPYIRPADMTDEQGVLAPEDVMRTSAEIARNYSRSQIHTGDIVCSIGPSFGKVMVTPQWLDGANLTQGTARIAIQQPHDARFTFWTLRSLNAVAQWESSVGGATFRALNLGPLATTAVPKPSPSEQTAIAAFLDRETSKIDALVAEQRRLMELLKEKRQAVISHAVTKGLDPNAPMKPSGIEWLGDVPAHWAVPPLYVRYNQALGKMLDQAKMSGEHPMPYLRNQDVRWDYINVEDLPLIDIDPHERDRFTVRKGDLLSVEGRELGRSAIWNGDDGVVAFQKALHRLRPLDATEHTRFFYYTMAFANSTSVFIANHSPDEIPHLTGEELRRYRFPKPPHAEQIAIAEFLDRKTQQLDTLTAEAQRTIDLLQERRTALISAAVTGQIDVRGVGGGTMVGVEAGV